jgi:hypothetical protein
LREVEAPIFSDIRHTDLLLGCRPYAPTNFTDSKIPLLIFVRGLVEPRAIAWLEILDKLKKPPQPGLEPATFRLIAWCLNQLLYRMPQNHDIKIGNKCFENVAQFRYLGATLTNRILTQEEINGR